MAISARTLILARNRMLRKNENGQQPWLPAVLGLLKRLHRLPVSATAAAVEPATATAAVEAAATTVEATAAAVEPATTVEATAAVEAAARGSAESIATVEPVTTKSTAEATTTYKSATTHESPPADEPTTEAAIEAEATAKTPASPWATPAPPRAGADEHSTREPIRPIVAVRRTSIRRVAVVAIVAHRRTVHIARSNPHPHTHLRL
jgi:hypothetical protein